MQPLHPLAPSSPPLQERHQHQQEHPFAWQNSLMLATYVVPALLLAANPLIVETTIS
jgi:hypothetical protein